MSCFGRNELFDACTTPFDCDVDTVKLCLGGSLPAPDSREHCQRREYRRESSDVVVVQLLTYACNVRLRIPRSVMDADSDGCRACFFAKQPVKTKCERTKAVKCRARADIIRDDARDATEAK